MLDHRGRPIAAITGLGVVTSLGTGRQDNWSALVGGRSGIRRIQRFDPEGLSTTIAGQLWDIPDSSYRPATACFDAASSAIEEALSEAVIGSKQAFPGPLVTAVAPVETDWQHRLMLPAGTFDGVEQGIEAYRSLIEAAGTGDWQDEFLPIQREWIAESLADKFGTRGVPVSISTACASGASAIRFGVDAIRRRSADAVLCVGTDVMVYPEAILRFSLLSALSVKNDVPEEAAKPFSRDRDGFVMGEGAAALVLESLESARARGADILGFVRGCGERADGFHRTRSNPDGSAIIGAIGNALADAAMDPELIDYVNAHGTGTPENDKMEFLALRAVFGEHLAALPVSSNKSMIGHTLSAAGAIEAVFSVLSMQSGTLPPTINYRLPDPEIVLDVVPNVSRTHTATNVLSNSFGFGGQNVSLVFSAKPD